MRILGLDYGEKRIGVALSDELGLTAQPLMTLQRKSRRRDLEDLAQIIRTHGVERIVVGYPLRLDGSEGIQCEKVQRFITSLESAFGVPVVRRDETLSTRQAEEILAEAGVRREKRRELVDRIAAGLILQGYLDALRTEKAGNPESES
ncbi:MAG TPA: Holliday junction resolvase RuvX [Syntrophales bacterium]|nr:Holliday junction resolvase RuvX [Syntrophales bacterium]